MTREQFINNYEADNEVETDGNFDAGVNEPCHGDYCHDECDCWESFALALDYEVSLTKQI